MSGHHWYIGKQALKESIARNGIDQGVNKWWDEWIHECFSTSNYFNKISRKHPEIIDLAWRRAKWNLGDFVIKEEKFLFKDERQRGLFDNPMTEVKISVCIMGKEWR